MKKIIKKRGNGLLLLLALVMGIVSVSVAQGPGYGQGKAKTAGDGQQFCKNIPDLTEDQQKKIETLRTKHLKETTAVRNKMKVKQAELKILKTADKVDMKAVNGKIDEISGLRTQLMKNGAAHQQEIRKILTDEQRVYFDARSGNKGHGQGYGQKGQGRGQGNRGHGNRGYGNNGNCQYR